MAQIADYEAILASPERQRQIVGDRARRDRRQVRRRPAHRRSSPTTATCPSEDLIAEEDVVVTITRGGYAKRTKTDLYRAQRRGGKGVRGAQLRTDDIVEHFFVTTTHDWILFFTNKGRVYRAKAYELPDAGAGRPRPARGQPAGVPAGRADRRGAGAARLRGRAVPGAGHRVRAGEEVAADRLRLARGRAASSRSTCARTTRSSRPGWSRPRRTCCWSASTPRRSGSAPTTRRCGRWAGPPPA